MSFKLYQLMIMILVVLVGVQGILMGTFGVKPNTVIAIGGAILLIAGVINISLISKVSSKVQCPHCNEQLQADVTFWTGHLRLHK